MEKSKPLTSIPIAFHDAMSNVKLEVEPLTLFSSNLLLETFSSDPFGRNLIRKKNCFRVDQLREAADMKLGHLFLIDLSKYFLLGNFHFDEIRLLDNSRTEKEALSLPFFERTEFRAQEARELRKFPR